MVGGELIMVSKKHKDKRRVMAQDASWEQRR